MKKRSWAILMCVLMLVSLAGCKNLGKKVKVELFDYNNIVLSDLTDEAFQTKLDEMASALKSSRKVDRAAQLGDIVNIDFVGILKETGEAFEGGSSNGFDLTLGSHQFIDGFEDGLVGYSAGEEVAVDLSFPEVYPNNPDLQSKEVTFNVKINSVSEPKAFEFTDEDLTKETNGTITSAEEFKKQYREYLNSSLHIEQIQKQMEENCKVSNIDKEVETQFNKLYSDISQTISQYVAYYGATEEQVIQLMYNVSSKEELEDTLRKSARREVSWKYIADELFKKEGIELTDEEKDAFIKQMASNYQVSVDELIQYQGEETLTTYAKINKTAFYILEKLEGTSEETEEMK